MNNDEQIDQDDSDLDEDDQVDQNEVQVISDKRHEVLYGPFHDSVQTKCFGYSSVLIYFDFKQELPPDTVTGVTKEKSIKKLQTGKKK